MVSLPSFKKGHLRKRISAVILFSGILLGFILLYGLQIFFINFSSTVRSEVFSAELSRKDELELAEQIYERNLKRRALKSNSIPLLAIPAKFYWMCPLYPCFGEERLGNWGDGGKWICRIDDLRNKPIIVYSVGCNGDVSFERDVWNTLGVKTFTFDPTLSPRIENFVKRKKFLHFHRLGLTHESNLKSALYKLKAAVRGSEMMRIEQIMSKLNHTYVDVFKVDCEGCEFEVMRRIHRENTREKPLFGQILMEIHEFGKRSNKVRLMQIMEEMGYRLFHVEPNYHCKSCFELAYIHENLLRS